jgi:hypothetical protein
MITGIYAYLRRLNCFTCAPLGTNLNLEACRIFILVLNDEDFRTELINYRTCLI